MLSPIPHRERKDIAYNQNEIETIVFEVAMKREKWFFIGIYLPGSVIIRHLKNVIEYICQRCNVEGKATLIMGNINVDFQKYVNQIQESLDVFDLTNLVKGPTCFKNHLPPSGVDVILTTCPRWVSSYYYINIGVSDHHNIIIASTKMHANHHTKKQITYRSYWYFNELD